MGQGGGKPASTYHPPITVDIEHSSLSQNETSVTESRPNAGKDADKGTEESTNSEKKKTEKSKPRPVPILKHRPADNIHESTTGSSSGSGQQSSAPPLTGPNRVKRLFRRHSSMRVCPDGSVSPGAESGGRSLQPEPRPSTSNPASPSPTAGESNVFLFNGLLTPVSLPKIPDADEGFITVTQLYNSMNDGQLCPYMFDPTYLLMIDTRIIEDYTQQHIVTAKHISHLNDPLKVEPLELYTMIILYDHKGLSHTLPDSLLSKTVGDLRRQGLEPFVLVGGFDSFHEAHHYLCTEKIPTCEAERQLLIIPYPSIILPGQLYLGRGDQATCNHIMTNLKITHILNVTKDHRNAFPTRVQYLQIEVDDDSRSNLLKEFPSAVKFIMDAVADSGRVMVHCNLGVSRSSTMVIAYLMYTRRWTVRDARLFLKERRPISHPNNHFMAQLIRFEEMLYGKKFTNPHQLY